MWVWLTALIADYVPHEDHRAAALVMVDELMALGGFTVSERTRRYFEDVNLNKLGTKISGD